MIFATLPCDPDVQALSIKLSGSDIVETIEFSRCVYVDIDAEGQAVGCEVLNADSALLAKVLPLPDVSTLRDPVKSNAA